VTGGSGVIGSDFVDLLQRLDLDHQLLSRSEADLSKCGDLTDVVAAKPTSVVHLAAAVPSRSLISDSDASAEATRRIDRCVLRAALKWKARLVYASGCSLYDPFLPGKNAEDAPLQKSLPSPYLRAKLDGERQILNYESGLVLRISAPLASNLPDTVVAMRFLRTALAGGVLELLGSGSRQQNYLDTRDIADCLLLATKSSASGIFNVASDQPITMRALANVIISHAGSGIVKSSSRSDPREGHSANYSNEKSRRSLGWSPIFSLEDSIDTIIRRIRAAH